MPAATVWILLGLGTLAVVLLIVGSLPRLWGRPKKRWFTAATIAGIGALALLMMVGVVHPSRDRAVISTWRATTPS